MQRPLSFSLLHPSHSCIHRSHIHHPLLRPRNHELWQPCNSSFGYLLYNHHHPHPRSFRSQKQKVLDGVRLGQLCRATEATAILSLNSPPTTTMIIIHHLLNMYRRSCKPCTEYSVSTLTLKRQEGTYFRLTTILSHLPRFGEHKAQTSLTASLPHSLTRIPKRSMW